MDSRIGSILMLHRTAPYVAGNLVYNENMKISPDELEHLIVYYKNTHRVFLSLDEATEIIRSGKKPKHQFVVLTLDDGYKDNLQTGYSVFRKHNVPFCIYITNCFPNNTADLWWYALEDVIQRNTTLKMPGGKFLKNNTEEEKKKNFLFLRAMVINEHFKDPNSFFRQLGEFNFDVEKERKLICLTWNEISELASDPLTTIGSHTSNHLPLSKLDENEARNEIVNSKDELEKKLNRPIKHFAFPFGSHVEAGPRDYEIARTAGFDSITTTLHGYVRAGESQYCLDRLFLSPLNGASVFQRELFWNIKSAVRTLRGSI
jgi:peptidoglycan/xylan/chitin deacetylase (PgdA/CDA1 family)